MDIVGLAAFWASVFHCWVEALVNLFATIMGKRPAFRAHGGSNAENLALQNIQVGPTAHGHRVPASTIGAVGTGPQGLPAGVRVRQCRRVPEGLLDKVGGCTTQTSRASDKESPEALLVLVSALQRLDCDEGALDRVDPGVKRTIAQDESYALRKSEPGCPEDECLGMC
eukprot:scaffold49228_cov21-Tisochrysis_lutea.AAC.3